MAVHTVECHEDSGKEYVHEIEGCIGSANGATVIDQKFETFLCNLDVPGYPKVFSRIKHKPQVWNDLMANFETCKVTYGGKGEMEIEMPTSMFVQCAKEASVIFENLVQHKSPQAYIKEGYTLLRVPADKCLEWYEPTISSTVELVRELHTKHHVEARPSLLWVVLPNARSCISNWRKNFLHSTWWYLKPQALPLSKEQCDMVHSKPLQAGPAMPRTVQSVHVHLEMVMIPARNSGRRGINLTTVRTPSQCL